MENLKKKKNTHEKVIVLKKLLFLSFFFSSFFFYFLKSELLDGFQGISKISLRIYKGFVWTVFLCGSDIPHVPTRPGRS